MNPTAARARMALWEAEAERQEWRRVEIEQDDGGKPKSQEPGPGNMLVCLSF